MAIDRKEAARNYKETPRTMGVLVIRNKITGRALIGSSTDVPARLNRHRAALQFGKHPSRDLQNDWNTLGADAFEFAVLDTLKASEEKASDPSEDLAVLEAMWRDKLSVSGDLYD
ncbi:MAG TPA: GIY-YIG nuclease family protein [Thermoanaerobaculia bacterium]|jgi:hypothetical protein|nr:GIY-YIG nuclease family protein [Thermoanaerobaculia bacterium]